MSSFSISLVIWSLSSWLLHYAITFLSTIAFLVFSFQLALTALKFFVSCGRALLMSSEVKIGYKYM